ncbi:MAG: hypothetical protein D6743_11175 [Calditrichaeota bacterium]|nr:MAG: hypothetical protein D6743_11175 [Calditrichota bacterium]
MKTKRVVFLTKIAILVFSGYLYAANPKIVKYRSQSDFAKGEPRGVSINSVGEVFLAPQIESLFDAELPFLWACVSDADGNVFVAGGNQGKVFRVAPDGKTKMIFEAESSQVYALAVDGKNNLYVASSPEGKVYKLTFDAGGNAKATEFFDPEEVYVWSLALDGHGNLWVATGEPGNIYKVDPAGKATLFYETEDTHVRKIIFDDKGNLVAGTADKGLIMRIDPSGKAFVLFDSPLVEITDLLIDHNGDLYAAASGASRFQRPRQPAPATNPPNLTSGNEGNVAGDEDLDLQVQQISVSRSSRSAAKNSALYRIGKDGRIETFWTSRPDRIHALSEDDQGHVLLATGDHGRLYSMSSSGEFTLLAELDEMQLTVLEKARHGAIYIGTSNAGKVYRLNRRVNSEGEYISEVFDAKIVSRWGSVNWEAEARPGAKLMLFSRSGNTEEPDKTWSEWAGPYSVATGESIKSPAARFLQLKAKFVSRDGKSSSILKELSFSYLQKNVAPEIKKITIHAPGDYYPDAASQVASNSHLGEDDGGNHSSYQNKSPGRKTHRKGMQSISWSVDDANGDNLSFDLYYRGEDENNWKPLVKDFKGYVYSWNSQLVPDGRYLVKLQARDDLSNPPALSLSSSKVSRPFVVDNTGPVVSKMDVRRQGDVTLISFRVEDGLNSVESVEYAVNAEDWQILYPTDGICDSRLETFELKLDSLVKGSNTIVIKARDALGNIGFGKGHIEI